MLLTIHCQERCEKYKNVIHSNNYKPKVKWDAKKTQVRISEYRHAHIKFLYNILKYIFQISPEKASKKKKKEEDEDVYEPENTEEGVKLRLQFPGARCRELMIDYYFFYVKKAVYPMLLRKM